MDKTVILTRILNLKRILKNRLRILYIFNYYIFDEPRKKYILYNHEKSDKLHNL